MMADSAIEVAETQANVQRGAKENDREREGFGRQRRPSQSPFSSARAATTLTGGWRSTPGPSCRSPPTCAFPARGTVHCAYVKLRIVTGDSVQGDAAGLHR